MAADDNSEYFKVHIIRENKLFRTIDTDPLEQTRNK